MKNLNLFRKSARGSEGSTLASAVVRPSFGSRSTVVKHLAFMLLFLLGSLNVWGADVIDNAATSAKCSSTATNSWVSDFSISGASGAEYCIHTMGTKNTSNALQWNTNGFMNQTKSGGTLKSVTIKGTNNKSVKIYAANSAYSTSKQTGTALATLNLTGADVTYTFENDYTYLALVGGASSTQIVSITIEYKSGGGSTPSLSVSPTVIDFGTVDKDASVEAQEVTVTYENLTGAVAYSGLSGAFTASGTIAASGNKITITPNTANTGNFQQTLTVQSEADSKSAEVTVKMNVVEPFDGKKLTFDVSSNPGEWPTANDASLTNYTYTLNAEDYTFALKNIKCNSGYLMMTATAVLGLPAIEGYKLVKVEATNSSGCSTSTQVKITSDEAGDEVVSGGASQTFSTTSTKYTYTLSGTTPNTMYYLIATNKNCQLVTLDLYYEEDASAPKAATPTFPTGDEYFLTSTSVALASATDGAEIRYTTDGTDPTSTSALFSDPIDLSSTTTIKAIAIKDGYDNSAVAEKTFTKGTKINVAEAIALIPNTNDTQDNQFVEGYVCTVGTSVSSGQMTYYISDDGTETNRLQIFKGKNLNNTNFTATSDLSLQDKVVVFGQLKNYSGTPEMNSGNYIVSREAAAIATPTFTPDGAGFLTTLSVALACETEGAQIRYTLDGSAPTEMSTLYSDPIELSATTTITAAAFKGGNASSAVARTFTKGSVITVTAALAAIDALADNGTIENQFVEGVISQIDSYNGTYHSITYWISADGTTTDQLEVYSGLIGNAATPLGKEAFDAKENLEVGDQVVIYGTLKKYVKNETTTPEFDKNNIIYSFNRPVVQTYSITYVENGANEDIEDVAAATNLPNPLPTVTKNEKVFGGWFTTSTFDGGTEAVAGAALSDDVILYAKWNDLSPWATVYSSNITLSTEGGTSASVAKVIFDEVGEDGCDAIKAGTGSVYGAIKVTIPAQATKLHYHAYGWNGEAVTLSITAPDGVTVTPASQVIESNTGVKSSTPFTLAEGSDPKTEAYHAVSLSGNTEEIELTFTATGGKRFVLFGVNQEGGVVPELQSIEISGDLNKKSGYKAGDALDLDGLTVMATYTLGGTPQTPVNITDKLGDGLTLTYDPLVEGQTEVTITATYEGKSDDIEITGLEVASADPKIYVNNLNVNFGTVAPNASVDAQTITVTLTNVAAATATLGGTNPEAFSITPASPAALTESGDITISVVSTANVGTYSATITISDDASAAESKIVNLSLTVEDVETAVSTTSKWVAATSADLVDGAEVLIVGVNNTDYYAMGVQNSNNRAAVAASVDGEGVLIPGEGTMSFILVAQGDGTFALRTSNSKYLYAAASGSNHLKTQAEVDVNAKWTISASSAVAEGSSNRNVMQFNSGSSIFSCYGSASQKPIALYVPQVVEPVYETVRENLTPNNYYTVCLDRAVTAVRGASFWTLKNRDNAGTMVYLEEEIPSEEHPFAAGKPFIIQAAAAVLEVVYTGDATTTAGSNGALRGTLEDMSYAELQAKGEHIYLLIQNAIRPIASDNYLNANRAYIDYDALTAVSSAPLGAPGRRVRAMPMAPQVATGLENGELMNDAMVKKVLINGQLFILRGEKMYDAKGQLVK